jgi:hypothetical protein
VTAPDTARCRLAATHLARPRLADPAAVVATLGAVQSQDYPAAKWAVGQRTVGAADANVERAFADGAILRTHVLRPTWHFVTPADIRWMLALTGPRVHQANAGRYRDLGLDAATRTRGDRVLARALRDGPRTRPELAAALTRAGIVAEEQRTAYLVMHAELNAVICSGPRRGNQFTYALLDERAPAAAPLPRDEALARLASLYFATRGPATAHDFAWWSGLTVADARRGAEAARPALVREDVDGRVTWRADAPQPPRARTPVAHLLPNYDELFVGYKDRSALLQTVASRTPAERSAAMGRHVVEVDGQLVGGWTRTLGRGGVVVTLALLAPLSAAQRRAVESAVQRYGAFLGVGASIA